MFGPPKPEVVLLFGIEPEALQVAVCEESETGYQLGNPFVMLPEMGLNGFPV